MLSRVKVKLESSVFKDKVLVAGFHGIGYVGYLTVKHLVKVLNGRLVGHILTVWMPQFVASTPDGISTPYEIYDLGESILFVPNVPMSRYDVNLVPLALAEASISGGARLALLIGGLDNRFRKDEGDFRYAATHAFLAAHGEFIRDAKRLEEGLYIVGPLATMLAYYSAYDFPAVAILPYADPSGVDPLAAKVAVDFISRMLGVKVDTSELVQLAEEKVKLEKELEEIRKKATRGEEGAVPTFYV
ncbi:MAG: PAC2 family protein [Thermofilaceae archaeon]